MLPSTDEIEFHVKEGSTVPRKGFIPKREVLPDPMFQDKIVTKLINNLQPKN